MGRIIQGTVVSDKNDKTIVVSVSTRVTHPIYKKSYSVTKKYHAHDEQNKAKLDDIVMIAEVKPISKNKRWNLQEVVGTAGLKHVEETPAEATREKQVQSNSKKAEEPAEEEA